MPLEKEIFFAQYDPRIITVTMQLMEQCTCANNWSEIINRKGGRELITLSIREIDTRFLGLTFLFITTMNSLESQPGKTAQAVRLDKKTAAVVSAEGHAAQLKAEAHVLNPKEKLSAYFTIAAAAFGLISDGCMFNLESWSSRIWSMSMDVSLRSKQSHDNVQCLYLSKKMKGSRLFAH